MDNEDKVEDVEDEEPKKEKKKKKSKDKDKEEEETSDSEVKDKKKKKSKEKEREDPEEEAEEQESKKKKKKSKDKDKEKEEEEDDDKENKKKKKSKDKEKDKDDEEEDAPKKEKKKKNKNEDDEGDEPKKDKKKRKEKEDRPESDREDTPSTPKKKKKKDKDAEDEDDSSKKVKKKKKSKEDDGEDTKEKDRKSKSLSADSKSGRTVRFPLETFEDSQLFHVLETINSETFQKVVDLVGGDNPKVNVNLIGDYSETYLHVLAAPRSDEEVNMIIPILYLLVSCGINLNAQDKEGNTALHICALNDVHHSIANTLIKLGIDPCILNCDDQDAMDLATNEKLKSVLSYFDPGIWRAIEEKNEDAVKVLIDSWCVIDIDKDDQSLVQLAENSENDFIKEYVLNNRASIRMCHAAMSANTDVLRKILKSDEEINYDLKDWSFLRDDGQRTPWPLLAELIRLNLLEAAILLMRRADVNVMIEPRKDIRMPLFLWAIRYIKKPDILFLKALLKRADLTLLENPMELLYEAWCNDLPSDVVEIFTKQGIPFTLRDQKGYTLRDKIFMETYTTDMNTLKKQLYWIDQHVLEMARDGKRQELENMLLDGYEYVLVSDMKGKTTYNYAKKGKQKETARWLKELPDIMVGT